MNLLPSSIVLLFVLLANYASSAQQIFVEGELVYKITIKQNNPEQKIQEVNGLYSIKIKGGAILKELILDNNFKSTKLILSAGRSKASYAYVQMGDKHFAVQQDFALLTQQIGRCKRFDLKELPLDLKTYGSFNTKRAYITCNDQRPIVMCYTEEWNINNPYVFEEFSSFTYLPLNYQLNLDNGSEIVCEFVRIDPRPMNNSDFEVPKNYTIISQEELRSWQH